MEELEKCIKRWNLVFTKTCDRLDFCIVGFDINNQKVNYEKSISLYDLIVSFNKLYTEFENEYKELQKYPLAKKEEYIDFAKFKNGSDLLRVLIMYIEGNIYSKHQKTILYLREVNGMMRPFVTNNVNRLNIDYYNEDVYVDEDKAKKYLDLFEKYKYLFDIYNDLKNSFIYSDGTYTITSSIDDCKSNILEGLNKLSLYIGASYFDSESYIKLVINLGENFGIKYDECSTVIDSEERQLSGELLEKVFNEIHIDESFTRKRKN